MTRLPDFYVLGVMRGGTSTMFQLLNQHPKIKTPTNKEIHFLSNEEKMKKPIDYRQHFPDKKPGELTFDCSHSYFIHSDVVPERIKAITPKAKFIVLIREPTERAWSELWIEDNEAAKEGKISLNSKLVRKGHYDTHVKRWFKHFDVNQFLFIKSESFFKDPIYVVNEIFVFLGLSAVGKHGEVKQFDIKPEFWDAAESKKARYGEKPEIPEELRDKLVKHYIPHLEKLIQIPDFKMLSID